MPQNRLRELREESGLTMAGLAAKLSGPVHESTISRWERSVTSIPETRKHELAELLGVSVPFLMGWDQPNGNGGNGERAAA